MWARPAIAQPQSNGSLHTDCTPRIVAYKKPRSVDIVADLPKNLQNKILKREPRERY